ncbi:MAG: DUF6879 family protein [Gammaproteobacteria bacterium]
MYRGSDGAIYIQGVQSPQSGQGWYQVWKRGRSGSDYSSACRQIKNSHNNMPSPIEAFEQLRPIKLEEFKQQFLIFRREAFRLETLPIYNVPSEATYIERYDRGEPCPADFNDSWLTTLRNAKANGKRFTRVRFVSGGVITPYLRFEAEWGYKRNMQAGEEIVVLQSASLAPYVDDVPILSDFWLFDDNCFIMYYDSVGRFLGVQRVPPSLVGAYLSLSQKLVASSTPFTENVLAGLYSSAFFGHEVK